MTHPAILTICATSAPEAYRKMRGHARMTWLREQARQLENGHSSTAEQRDALAAIAFITKASESAAVRDLGQRLCDALARVNGFEEQAACDAAEAQPEALMASGETTQELAAACADSAGLNQSPEFDGLSEAAVRVFHAILRTIGTRPYLYFDEVPVAELGRMTVGQIRQAADELQAANIIDQLNPAGVLHQVSLRPGLLDRFKAGVVRLPLPKNTVDGTRNRAPRSSAASGPRPPTAYAVGTSLIGRNGTVCIVAADGYAIGGTKFNSLTAAATHATGKRTSGPSFWRVNAPAVASQVS